MADTTTKSLAFVALKHLFPEVPVNGGEPRRVTPFAGFFTDPVYSPDGGKVAFVSGGARGLGRAMVEEFLEEGLQNLV